MIAMWNLLRVFNLVLAFLATTAPVAHVLELANKLVLDGALWLEVQRSLYRGWGPVFGNVEALVLLSSLALALHDRPERLAYGIAVFCYIAMIAVFFAFNYPVNQAIVSWSTPAMLPANWPEYRRAWETGHAIAALMSLVAFGMILHAQQRSAGTK